MTKPSIFNKINQSLNNPVDSSVIPESEAVESNNNALTDSQASAHQIQQLEVYLDNLVSNLQQGQLPVNLKKVTQVFDGLVTQERLPIDIPAQKFVELYNDLPNILIGYAIEATLSDETYRQTDTHLITFHRQNRGSYWIFPTDRIGKTGAAWLVPNPLKNTKLDRVKSLKFCFDFISSNSNNNLFILAKPALVKILTHQEQLMWKLTERGEIINGGEIDALIVTNKQYKLHPDQTQQIKQLIQDQLYSYQQNILKQCENLPSLVEKIVKSKLELLQSTQNPPNPGSNTPSLHPSSSQPFNAQPVLPIQSYEEQKVIDTVATPAGTSVVSERTNESFKKYLVLAQENKQQKNYAEALLNYDRAIQLNPNGAEAYFRRARLKHHKLQDYPGSLADYDKAIELDPNNAEFYCNRAYLHQYTYQNYPEALADYDQAIELNPDWTVAIEYRNKLLTEQRKYKTQSVDLPFINQYNDRVSNFTDKYRTIDIVRDEDNYNQIHTGQTEDTILTTNNRHGNYWLFTDENISYLVPNYKFKIHDQAVKEAKYLFDCNTYEEERNYTKFTLVKPAIVNQQMDGNWKLKEKGILHFG